MSPEMRYADKDSLEWPKVALIAPRKIKLLEEFVVEWVAEGFPRQRLVVPKGFVCDGASIPAMLEWYLGRDNILPAAVPHDWQYAFGGQIPKDSHLVQNSDGTWKEADFVWSRKESDRFFARNLKFCSIKNHQRRNAYRAVRIGGWFAWRSEKTPVIEP